MLKRFRIEVEEQTIAECVDALARYTHALQALEANRYHAQWPIELTANTITDGDEVVGVQFPHEIDAAEEQYPTDCEWDMEMGDREFYMDELGAETTEELIEYDASIPGYKGRRVVRLNRIDMRSDRFLSIKPYFGWTVSGLENDEPGNSGTGTNP